MSREKGGRVLLVRNSLADFTALVLMLLIPLIVSRCVNLAFK